MRRREREITEESAIRDILDRAKILHLGLADGDDPYVVPMNYGYTLEDGKLTFYLHGANEGYKYEVIRKNPKISFSVECDVEPFSGRIACQYGTTYASVLGRGVAHLVEEPREKMQALTTLMKTQTGGDFTFTEQLVSIVGVIRLDITGFSAKRRPMPGVEHSEA